MVDRDIIILLDHRKSKSVADTLHLTEHHNGTVVFCRIYLPHGETLKPSRAVTPPGEKLTSF